MLKEFKVHPRQEWNNTCPFGGGHTAETDPTRRGWQMKVRAKDVVTIGRPGVPGFFSARRMENGFLDVLLYEEDIPGADLPKHYDFDTRVVPTAGWALEFIELLEQ